VAVLLKISEQIFARPDSFSQVSLVRPQLFLHEVLNISYRQL
jgi:hypothetical protein